MDRRAHPVATWNRRPGARAAGCPGLPRHPRSGGSRPGGSRRGEQGSPLRRPAPTADPGPAPAATPRCDSSLRHLAAAARYGGRPRSAAVGHRGIGAGRPRHRSRATRLMRPPGRRRRGARRSGGRAANREPRSADAAPLLRRRSLAGVSRSRTGRDRPRAPQGARRRSVERRTGARPWPPERRLERARVRLPQTELPRAGRSGTRGGLPGRRRLLDPATCRLRVVTGRCSPPARPRTGPRARHPAHARPSAATARQPAPLLMHGRRRQSRSGTVRSCASGTGISVTSLSSSMTT